MMEGKMEESNAPRALTWTSGRPTQPGLYLSRDIGDENPTRWLVFRVSDIAIWTSIDHLEHAGPIPAPTAQSAPPPAGPKSPRHDLLSELHLRGAVKSFGEARRLIEQGAVWVNGEKATRENLSDPYSYELSAIRVGKKDFDVPKAAPPVEPPAPRPMGALADIAAERERQKAVEGWTEDHDDAHGRGEMAVAGACYALWAFDKPAGTPNHWPWDRAWWKPKNPRRDLIRAAALILAEIESCDRTHAWPDAPEAQAGAAP